MSFSTLNKESSIKSIRKEKFVLTFINRLPFIHINKIYLTPTKRTSASTFFRGSMTVEASLAVPVFFIAFACLLYLMEIMAIQTSMRSGLQYAQKELSCEANEICVINPAKVQELVVHSIGEERVERSIVMGGCNGVNCQGSFVSPFTGIGQLKVRYQVRVPFFHIAPLTYEQGMGIKEWNGYQKSGLSQKQEIVYVTETGLVYHKNYRCTHLDLSVRAVKKDSLENLRNHNGGKYYPCERCAAIGKNNVFITDNGDRYHGSLTCSGLKRTIYAVPKSEIVGKAPCSKCGR